MAGELTKATEESARSGFFLFSGATLATVIMAISAILIGRLLGPELYGQYSLVLVVPSLLLLVTDLGTNTAITKFAASLRADGKHEMIASMIRRGTLLRLVVGVPIFIISLVFANLFAELINRPDFTFFIQLALTSIIFQVIYGTTTSAFVGLDRLEYYALATNIQAISKTILQMVLVLLGFSIAGALVGYVGGFVIASILASFMLFFRLLKPTGNAGEERLGETVKLLAHYGMPLYVSILFAGFLPIYQQVILAFFASDVDLGNYRAALNFVSLLAIIPSSITTVLLPAFSKLDSSTPENVNAFFQKANKYSCLLVVPTTTLIVLFSKQIVELIYGPIYNSAPLFLTISSLSYFLAAIGYIVMTSLFNGLGKTGLTLRATVIYSGILIVLSPFLAKAYSVPGLLVASLLSNVGGAAFEAYVGRTKLRVHFNFKPISKIYFAAGLSILPPLTLLYLLPFNALPVFLVGMIMYLFTFVTLMPIIGIVDINELDALTRVTRKIPLLSLFARPFLSYQRRILTALAGRKA